MKSLTALLIMITLSCCSSDENIDQFNLDVGFEFSITDDDGNDLLNPENSNFYNHSEIKLFYKNNGEYVEVYNENSDYPRNIKIYKHADNYRIGVTLNHSTEETNPETLIMWNESESDTIKCEIYQTNSLIRIDKVWLNNNLIWDSSNNSEPYFQITK